MRIRTLPGLIALCIAVPAGVADAGYFELIQLNNRSNHAVLEDDGDPENNIIQIRSTNGTFRTIQFEQPDGILTIDLRGGDDILTIEGNQLTGFTADLFILGGNGNDTTNIRGLDSSGSVFSEDNRGDNSLELFFSHIGGSVNVTDGVGHQTLRILGNNGASYPAVSGDVNVDSRGGPSTCLFGDSVLPMRINGNLSVNNSGYGDDSTDIGGRVAGHVRLQTGNGNASLRSLFSSVGSLEFLVRAGMSNVFLGDFLIGGDSEFSCKDGSTDLQFYYSTFAGRTVIKNGLGFDSLRTIDLGTSELSVENGDGGSVAQFRRDYMSHDVARAIFINGEGYDEITIGNQLQMEMLNVDNGNGNSRVTITDDAEIGKVVITNGNGFDHLTVDRAVIHRDLISINGNGGSGVLLQDAYVGGFTDIQSQADSDYYRIYDSTPAGDVNLHTHDGHDLFSLSNSVFLSDFVGTAGEGFDILETSNDNFFGGLKILDGFDWIIDL